MSDPRPIRVVCVRRTIAQWCHCAFSFKKPIGLAEVEGGAVGNLVHGVPGIKTGTVTVVFDGFSAPVILPSMAVTSQENVMRSHD
jgi:hypothetical protein